MALRPTSLERSGVGAARIAAAIGLSVLGGAIVACATRPEPETGPISPDEVSILSTTTPGQSCVRIAEARVQDGGQGAACNGSRQAALRRARQRVVAAGGNALRLLPNSGQFPATASPECPGANSMWVLEFEIYRCEPGGGPLYSRAP